MLWKRAELGHLEYKLVIYKLITQVMSSLNNEYLLFLIKKLSEMKDQDLTEAEINLAEETISTLYRNKDHKSDL